MFIRATPEQVWEAITKPEFTAQYFFGSVMDSTYETGAAARGRTRGRATQFVDGEVLEADRPRRLVYNVAGALRPRDRSRSRTAG